MDSMPGGPQRTSPEEAADRIRERRAACDDSEFLPDDAAGVARYARTHRKVPPGVLAADMEDALIIRRALRDEADREDLGVIRAARACGITWARIAEIWGFRGRQGAVELAKRLEAVTGHGRQRDPRLARPRPAAAGHEPAWADRGDQVLRDVAEQIAGWAYLLPAHLAGAIADMAGDLADPEVTPAAVMAALSAICHQSRYPSPPGA